MLGLLGLQEEQDRTARRSELVENFITGIAMKYKVRSQKKITGLFWNCF